MQAIITREQNENLELLGAYPAWRHQGGTNDVVCEIKERLTGKVWTHATANSEIESFNAAYRQMNPSNKPLTPAAMAAELALYREKFGDLEDADEIVLDLDEDEKEDAALLEDLKKAGLEAPDRRKKDWRQTAREMLKVAQF